MTARLNCLAIGIFVTAGPGGPPSGNNLAMAMDRQIDAMRSYPVFCCHFNFDGGPYYTPEHLLSEQWRR
jgi:hypothetical protein